jgi:hypothetical protein
LKAYLLVEGRRTEKSIYKAWLTLCFPELVQVFRIEDLSDNGMYIVAGMGYPSYLDRIPKALADARYASVDHLFVCVDSEEEPADVRLSELRKIVEEALAKMPSVTFAIHLIVQFCCIETWLLGHQKLVPRNPLTIELNDYKKFFDVSVLDPQEMGPHPEFVTKAQFQYEYLREIFRHHAKSYSKANASIALERNYLDALITRYNSSGHIDSFGFLWKTLSALGAT